MRQGLFIRQGKVESNIETTPDCRIEKVAVIGRGQQKRSFRPGVDLLEQNCDKTLELANFGAVVTTFGHGVQFVEQQDGLSGTHIIEDTTQIHTRLAEKAAHDRRQVEHEEWNVKFSCDPSSRKCLSHGGRSDEKRRTRRNQPSFGQAVCFAVLVDDLFKLSRELARQNRFLGQNDRILFAHERKTGVGIDRLADSVSRIRRAQRLHPKQFDSRTRQFEVVLLVLSGDTP